MDRSRRAGMALVLGTALISGASIFVNHYAIASVAPGPFTLAKNALVALAVCAIALAAREWRALARTRGRDLATLALIGLVGGSAPFLLFFQGLSMMAGDAAGATTASFLQKTMFVPVAILAVAFLQERLDRALVAGAGLLMLGAALVLSPSIRSVSLPQALVLAAVALWSIEIVLAKRVLARGVPPNLVIVGRMGFGALFLYAWLATQGQARAVLDLTRPQWSWVLVTSAFLLAYVLTFYHGLRRVEASTAAALLAPGILVTWALEAGVRGAPLHASAIAGALLLIVGAALVAWRERTHATGRRDVAAA